MHTHMRTTTPPRTRHVRRGIAVAAATTAVAVLVACAPSAPADDAPSILRIAVTSLHLNFDPMKDGVNAADASPVMAAHDPLVTWDRTSSTFEPWLAEEFEVSDDGLTLSLKLREDVDFTDGTHFDAAALETYLGYLLAIPGTGPANMIGSYEPTVTATGDYTVDITTTKPMRFDFFYLLEEMGIASPVIAEDQEAMLEKPVGSGPYVLDEVVPDVSVTMVRNPDYWNPDAFPFDEIQFIVFSDQVASLNALRSGQIDAAPLSVELAEEAEEAGFALHEGIGTNYTLFFFDHVGSVVPALGDVRVRQAINLAFDREQILESMNLGFGRISSQAYAPNQPEYIEGGDDYYGYDPERAKELLAEAGYPDGFDLTILSGGSSASSFIATASVEPLVQQSLAEIGIRVTFDQFPEVGEWAAELTSGRHGVLVIPHIYTNVTRFINPEAMAGSAIFLPGGGMDSQLQPMLDKVNFGDAAEFDEGSQELGQFLLEEAWFAPFSNPPTLWASISGIDITVGDILGLPTVRAFQLAE